MNKECAEVAVTRNILHINKVVKIFAYHADIFRKYQHFIKLL